MPTQSDLQSTADGADRTNWRTGAHAAWAFHNVPALLPTAKIAAAGGAPAPMGPPVDFSAFGVQAFGSPVLSFAEFLDATATDALVVMQDGQVLFETYANGTTAHTPHILMSVTKAMTGLLVGALVGRGELDIEAVASDLVPEVARSGFRGVTLRQLTDMRAGVRPDERQNAAYDAALAGEPGAPGFRAILTDLQAPQPHGGPFAYISANTDMLAWAIERATGRRIADLFGTLLWKPMGASDDACLILDDAGSPWCTGGMAATARDFARVGELVINGGRVGDRQIVPEAWIDDLSQGGDREAWKTGEWGQAFAGIGSEMSYRAGWYAVHNDPQRLFAMGVHGQNLFVDRASRIVIAKLSSQARMDFRAVMLHHAAVAQIGRCVLERPA